MVGAAARHVPRPARPVDRADGFRTGRSAATGTVRAEGPAPVRGLPVGVRVAYCAGRPGPRPTERADVGRLSGYARQGVSRPRHRHRRTPVHSAMDTQTCCSTGTSAWSSRVVIPGLNWGARPSERTACLPCDGLYPRAGVQADRAISIDAPPSIVFRWLCQLRVAPYSYDILDNLGRRSPRERDPELVHLEVGQRFMTVFVLHSFAAGEQITLRSKGVAVTYRVRPEELGSRLCVRVLFAAPWPAGHVLALGDWVMMRKQLLTLKSLAERESAGRTAQTPPSR